MRAIGKLLIPFLCFSAHALEIRPESGAVTITMIDVLPRSNNKALSFSRFYNSASSQDGWFGRSFSSNFETRLQKEADGMLTIFEYGQIPGLVYTPASGVTKTDDLIELILKKKTNFQGMAQESYRKKLQLDREFLRVTAGELSLQGTPVEGEVFRSGLFGGFTVTFAKNSYTRELASGVQETFSVSGQLIGVTNPQKGQKITLTYGKDKRLSEVTDNFQNRILVTWGTDGHIARLTNGINGKTAEFSYEKGQLVSVTNELGQTFGYAYDQYGLLTRFTGTNGTTDITYDPKKRTPVEVKTSTGTLEKWFFEKKKTSEGELRIARREVKVNGNVSKESWETLIASGTVGNIPRQLKVTNEEGEVLTRFRPCCYPPPEFIVTPSLNLTFAYDEKDRLKEKKYQEYRTVKYEYDLQGRLLIVADQDREIKCEFQGASQEPKAYLGRGFRLEGLNRKKALDTFRIQWAGEKTFHEVQYQRNERNEVSAVKLDGETIVKEGIPTSEKMKPVYQKLEDALLSMNLLGEVGYDY